MVAGFVVPDGGECFNTRFVARSGAESPCDASDAGGIELIVGVEGGGGTEGDVLVGDAVAEKTCLAETVGRNQSRRCSRAAWTAA